MNKYRNQPVRSVKMLDRFTKGKRFRSKAEFNHALWLLGEFQAKRVKTFEYEKPYDLYAEGRRICGIVPDFTVTLPDGRTECHEVKAPITRTREWAIKKKLFCAVFPNIRYRVFEFGIERKEKVILWD